MESSSSADLFGVSEERLAQIRRHRKWKDIAAGWGIKSGGVSVIVAICLIFFYLLYEVVPLFMPAGVEEQSTLSALDVKAPYHVVMEEQGQVAVVVSDQGSAFINARTGNTIDDIELPISSAITAFSKDAPGGGEFALGFDDGSVLVHKPRYKIDYSAEQKRVIPSMEYPLGREPVSVLEDGPVKYLAVRNSETLVRIVAADEEGRLFVKDFEKVESFLSDDVELEELDTMELPSPDGTLNKMLLSLDQRWLFLLLNNNKVEMYDLRNPASKMRVHSEQVVPEGNQVTAFEFLLGGFSLLIGDQQGNIAQWFMARGENDKPYMANVRTLQMEEGVAITTIQTEHRRKSFIAGDVQGNIGLFNTTASTRSVFDGHGSGPVEWVAVSPRGSASIIKFEGEAPNNFFIDNEHPEVSWSSLWNQIWYERYEEPGFTWQSSSASNDFEPKFSLMPLTFGTMKAAFYAMMVAMPLAICGAIYTAYFMAPTLRTKVKPTIELMEAMPTVILGFLAGLWLAPLVEANLPGVVAILILTPVSCIAAAVLWSRLPLDIQTRVPDGWVPVLLIPVVIFAGFFSMWISEPVEAALFDGSMRTWLSYDLGIDFDQRNSLVVGIAMGFAVIPTIFSITEDAIFAVPKGLTQGSLALGATPWQTMVRVVLPTASPGIFSALMIGLGRAVGETMIVLMATGNTPIMDMNIFEGLRTLSANIAVEMPEAEGDSSHFRILFLSGLVLFIFTFFVNTTAEVVRQRLREKFGSL